MGHGNFYRSLITCQIQWKRITSKLDVDMITNKIWKRYIIFTSSKGVHSREY